MHVIYIYKYFKKIACDLTEKYVFSAEAEMEFLLIPSMLDPNVHLSTWAIWIILEAGEFPSCTSCFVWNIVMKKGNTSIAFPRPQNSLKHKKYYICSIKRQNLMEVLSLFQDRRFHVKISNFIFSNRKC